LPEDISISETPDARDVIMAALVALGNDAARIGGTTELLAVGLIDSKALLDIILEVEQRCNVQFDPERINFEDTLTLNALAASFVPV